MVLPNKSKAYAKSLNAKSKTDSIDAKILAQMGLERQLEIWQPASHNMRRIKRLCRERLLCKSKKQSRSIRTTPEVVNINPKETAKNAAINWSNLSKSKLLKLSRTFNHQLLLMKS